MQYVLRSIAEEARRYEKLLFVDIDLVKGVGKDVPGVQFLAREGRVHGIITTRSNLIKSIHQVSPCKTKWHILRGSEGWEPNYWTNLARDYRISAEAARHLSDKFGTAASDVLTLANEDPQLKEPIVKNAPAIRAEVIYSVRQEMAMCIEDVPGRRIGMQLLCWEDAIRCAPVVGSLLAREFGWPPARQEEEVGKYIRKIAHLMQAVGLRPLDTFVDAD